MAHFLIVNANLTGMKTLSCLMDLGHEITYVESSSFVGYIADSETDEIKKRIKRVYYLEDTDNISKLIHLAEDINTIQKIDGVICVAENSMEPASAVAEHFGLPFPSRTAVTNSRNKEKTRHLLDLNGIRNARYSHITSLYELEQAAAIIGFPLVIKPGASRNSFGTAIVRSADQLMPAWNVIQEEVDAAPIKMQEQYRRGFIVEEYLQGKMVSVEVLHDGNTATVFMISGRQRSISNELIEYRIDMPASITSQEWSACEDYTLSVVQALQLTHGIFHIELIITNSGPVLVEVNPRLMGSYMPYLYNNQSGNNVFSWLADIHSGKRVDLKNLRVSAKIASAVRFDVVRNAEYIPDAFRHAVLKRFSPVYFELPEGDQVCPVLSGQTIGRMQIIVDCHGRLQIMLDEFYHSVCKDLNLELLQ